MTISVRFRALTTKPERFDVSELVDSVEQHMVRHAHNIIREVRHYPPPPPNSRYVRTYQLQTNWQLIGPHQLGGGLVMYITNDTPYAVYVQGNQQTWFHAQNGWQILDTEEVLQRKEYRRGLNQIVRRYAAEMRRGD